MYTLYSTDIFVVNLCISKCGSQKLRIRQVYAFYLPSHYARSLHPLYLILLHLFITTSSRWVMFDGHSKANGFPRREHQKWSSCNKTLFESIFTQNKTEFELVAPIFLLFNPQQVILLFIDKVLFPLPDILLKKGNCLWYMFSKQSPLDSQIAYSQSVLRLFGTRTWRPKECFFSYRQRDLPLNLYVWIIGTK